MISLAANPLDRAERLARVRRYLAALGLRRWRAIVFGSVGRGDFTAESDTDLLIVSDELPADPRARLDFLFSVREVAPEVEPIGWRGEDWRRREREGDPFIEILRREGLVLEP
ncbi:MAG: nucleotidyltransferase domain-containing protein [Burkholderiales bacterium]|nr:nucleotidyltransferase domain-containing protein [Burkholderiales bacterium]